MIAVVNRIPIPQETIGVKTKKYKNVNEIPITYFLPTAQEETTLKEEMKILLLREIVKYFDELSFMKKYVNNHIKHQYSELTTKISEVIPIGILDCNEATTEGMIEIMRYQHKLVPGNNTEAIVRTLSVGDLLTVERQQNAQEDLRDSTTSSTRMEGLISALADFHSYGNFMEVIRHLLYNPSSAMDIGTLFQARNFLNARAVPGSPMKDINACEELLFKYADALIITVFKYHLKLNNIDPKHLKGNKDNVKIVDGILDNIVEESIIAEVNHSSETKTKTKTKKYWLQVSLLRSII